MRTFLVVAAAVTAFAVQSTPIDRVERGLRGPIALKGEAPVRHTIAERLATHHVPGVSVAVVDGGKVAWARGYGQTGDGAAVTPETLFQAASLSKPLSAMVALRLVELGRLSLDEDVNVKLRSWKVPASDAAQGEPVTLRRLLSHTAGLTVSGFPGYAVDKPVPTLVQLLDGAGPTNTSAIRIDIKPGTRYRYSGGGYQVMQLLVEDVTGKPFAQVARELVLDPLGMKHSTFQQPLTGSALARSAAGHDGTGAAIAGKRHTYPELTAAGLWTTPSDYAQVIVEMHAPGRVLRRETVDTMLTPVMNGYGLGFGVQTTEGHPSFSHNGGNEGFRCTFRGYRDRPGGAVVMTNGDNGSRLMTEVMRAIAAEYGWPDYKQSERSIVAVTPEVLQSYVGRYRLPGGEDIVVAVRGSDLTVQGPGEGPVTMTPGGGGLFFNLEGRAPELTFSQPDGKPMQVAGAGFVAVRQ